MQVADAIIIIISWILDVLTFIFPIPASIIIFFLFWRIVRLINGTQLLNLMFT